MGDSREHNRAEQSDADRVAGASDRVPRSGIAPRAARDARKLPVDWPGLSWSPTPASSTELDEALRSAATVLLEAGAGLVCLAVVAPGRVAHTVSRECPEDYVALVAQQLRTGSDLEPPRGIVPVVELAGEQRTALEQTGCRHLLYHSSVSELGVRALVHVGLVDEEGSVPSLGLVGATLRLVHLSVSASCGGPASVQISARRDLRTALAACTTAAEAACLCLDTTTRSSEFGSGRVYLLEPGTGALRLVAHRGLAAKSDCLAEHFPGDSYQTRLVQLGERIYSAGGQFGTAQRLRLTDQLPFATVLPLRYRGEVIGCINLASDRTAELPSASQANLDATCAELEYALGRLLFERRADLSERRNELVAESLGALVWSTDSNHQLSYLSDTVATELGGDPQRLLGAPLSSIMTAESAERCERLLPRPGGDSAAPHWVRLCYSARDGSPTEADTLVRPLLGERSGLGALLGVAQLARPAGEQLRGPNAPAALQQQITDAAAALLSGLPPQPEATHALGCLAEMLGLSRLYVVQPPPEPDGSCSIPINWAAPGIEPLRGTGPSSLDGLFGEGVTRAPAGLLVAEDRDAIGESLGRPVADRGTRSLALSVQVRRGCDSCVVGFEDCRERRTWSGVELAALQLLGSCVAAAAARAQPVGALLVSENQLRAVLDGMSSGVLVTDASGRVTLVNEAARLTLRLGEGLRGRPLTDVLPSAESLLRDAEPGEQHKVTLELGDGSRIAVGFTSAVTCSGSHHIVTFRDLTAILEGERRRRRAEQLAQVGEMAAKLSHEIKNPLNSILVGLQVVERHAEVDDTTAELLDSVTEEVRTLGLVIGDLLESTRLQKIDPQPVLASSVVRNRFPMQRQLASARGVRIELVEGPADALLIADQHAMNRVLTNLVQNAVDACQQGQRIQVGWRVLSDEERTEALPGYRGQVLCLFVDDDGPGIRPGLIDDIFRPFVTGKEKGTGLGLAVAQELAHVHGGVVRATTDTLPDGGGARFEVLLPAGHRLCLIDRCPDCTSAAHRAGCACPQTDEGSAYVCWTIRGQATWLELGRWDSACTRCPVFLQGNLGHFYDARC